MNTRLPQLLLLSLAVLLSACTSFKEIIADGPIEEDYGSRTRGTEIEDRDIQSKIYINIRFEQSLQNANIKATAYNRNVLLTGQIADQNSRQLATTIAQRTRHVRNIHNELEIGQPPGFVARNNDRLLATKVRARLLAASDIDSARVETVVENGAVFFMGLVTRAESLRIINSAKEVAGIRKIVKVFEYID